LGHSTHLGHCDGITQQLTVSTKQLKWLLRGTQFLRSSREEPISEETNMSWTNMSPKNHLFRVATVMTGLLGICSPAFAVILAFSVDGGTVSKSTGQATISGQITCTNLDVVYLYGNVTQQRASSQRYAYGSGSTSLTCNGNPQTWTISISSYNYPFSPGNAGANVQAYDSYDGSQTTVNIRINLKSIP